MINIVKTIAASYFECSKIIRIYTKRIYFICAVRIGLSILSISLTYLSSMVVSDIIYRNINRFIIDLIFIILLKVTEKIIAYNIDYFEISLRKGINIYVKRKMIESVYRTRSKNLPEKGKLFNIIYGDSMSICTYVFMINEYLIQSISIVIMFSLIIILNFKIAIMLLTCVPILMFINNKYCYEIERDKAKSFKKADFFTSFLKSLILNVFDTNLNGYKRLVEEKAYLFMEDIKENDLKVENKSLKAALWTRCWKDLINIFVIFEGGIEVILFNCQIKNYIAINSYAALVTNNIERFSSLMTSAQQQKTSINRVKELLRGLDEDYGYFNCTDNDISLTLSNVEIGVNDFSLLKNINLEFKKNNVYYISGRNGVGKTTLLNTVCGIYPALEGDIKIGCIKTNDIPYYGLSGKICYVMQQSSIYYGLSIKENILMGCNVKEKDMLEYCKYFGIDKEIRKLGDGYNTIINDSCCLSAGQRKKIQLIRCLLADSSIYLFDEPTENLDETSRHQFYDILERIKQDKIMLIVTHDLIKANHNMIVIDSKEGKIL